MSSSRLRVDREGHVLDARRALGRRDEDFFAVLLAGIGDVGIGGVAPVPAASSSVCAQSGVAMAAVEPSNRLRRTVDEKRMEFPLSWTSSRGESIELALARKGNEASPFTSCNACCTLVTIVPQAKGSSDGSGTAASRTPCFARKAWRTSSACCSSP